MAAAHLPLVPVFSLYLVLGVFFLKLCALGKVFQTCTVCSLCLSSFKTTGEKLLLTSVSKLIPCLLGVSDYNELRRLSSSSCSGQEVKPRGPRTLLCVFIQ